MRLPAFRLLRQLRSGRRVDIPNLLGSDTTTIHATDAEAAVRQAKAYGHTGELVAIAWSN